MHVPIFASTLAEKCDNRSNTTNYDCSWREFYCSIFPSSEKDDPYFYTKASSIYIWTAFVFRVEQIDRMEYWCKSIFHTLERLRYTSNIKLDTRCAYNLVTIKISHDDRLWPRDVSAAMLVCLSMWVFECFTSSLQEPDKWTIDYIISNEDYIIKKLMENDRKMFRKFLLDLNSKRT